MKTSILVSLAILALAACNDAKAPANDSGDGSVVETEAGPPKAAAAPAASTPLAPDSAKPAAAAAPAASAAPAAPTAPADAGAAPKASAAPAKPAASAAPKK